MKICFYKLPSESGENVIITETYAYRDSELALMIEDKDLDLPYFDICVSEDGEGYTFIEVDADPESIDPYIMIDSTLEIEATLPFKNLETAERFVEALVKWQEFLDKAYDD